MKIAYIAAGAAGRFCGACLHDNTLATAMRGLGADFILVPTYTPLRTDEESASISRVFFGGVNVYLQEKWAFFRHTPWLLDSVLDSPALLSWLSRRSAGMDPADLGALTVSSLAGEHGHQRKEIAKLLRWLKRDVQPEMIHLSTVLLAGIAEPLRQGLGTPIVCTLSGEDILEMLKEPHYAEARKLLKQQAQHIDRFVALNNYFADFMASYMEVDRARIDVIPHGLNLDGHGLRNRLAATRSPRSGALPGDEVVIGYFARIAVEKGLHFLAEAFCLLAARTDLPPLRLKAAGYMSSSDRAYFAKVVERIARAGLSDRFDYAGELDKPGKIAFLQSLDVMSVPTVYHESKGISVLEAMANGVPLVLPRHGTFPELIERTGAGLLCEPLDPQSLADRLAELILDPQLAAECGHRGHAAIQAEHTAELMARRHFDLYARVSAGAFGGSVSGTSAGAAPGPVPMVR